MNRTSLHYSSQLIVFGYVRDTQQLFSQPPYHIIPNEVVKIVLMFYVTTDHWDEKYIAKGTVLRHQTVTKFMSSRYYSCFCNNIVEKGISTWIFKINKQISTENKYDLLFGIWTIPKDKNTLTMNTRDLYNCYYTNIYYPLNHIDPKFKELYGMPPVKYKAYKTWIGKIKDCVHKIPQTYGYFTDCGRGYGFNASSATLIDPDDGWIGWKRYGIVTKTGDEIKMILDLNECSLKYIINGHDYGIAYHVENRKYRAAIYMTTVGDSVTLV